VLSQCIPLCNHSLCAFVYLSCLHVRLSVQVASLNHTSTAATPLPAHSAHMLILRDQLIHMSFNITQMVEQLLHTVHCYSTISIRLRRGNWHRPKPSTPYGPFRSSKLCVSWFGGVGQARAPCVPGSGSAGLHVSAAQRRGRGGAAHLLDRGRVHQARRGTPRVHRSGRRP
jgi:hypothetical protein